MKPLDVILLDKGLLQQLYGELKSLKLNKTIFTQFYRAVVESVLTNWTANDHSPKVKDII